MHPLNVLYESIGVWSDVRICLCWLADRSVRHSMSAVAHPMVGSMSLPFCTRRSRLLRLTLIQ